MAIKVSGFTYIHNAIAGGYPLLEAIQSVIDYVDEMVVVDCASTDGTRKLLDRLGVRVIDGEWGSEAGETLKKAHALHTLCEGDVIVHFEADEIFDRDLIIEVNLQIECGNYDLAVWRLQLEQNFQRCRWYPEPVHRVFPRGSVTKDGHTTNRYKDAQQISPEWGYLWDCAGCFRDNWKTRFEQQAQLWGSEGLVFRRVPVHFLHDPIEFEKGIDEFLQEPQWTWTTTPFDIPDILKPLVGRTKYEVAL